jgi:hypothetical protein
MQRTVLIALAVLTGTATSAVYYVHPDSSQDNIQACLDMCSEGDTVLVGPGTYYEHITWPGTNGIRLFSEYGRDTTFIDGGDSGRVIWMGADADSNTVVRGFTIQNGYTNSADGGGIGCFESCTPLIEDNRFLSNRCERAQRGGGGVGCYDASPRIRSNRFEGNRAIFGGGIGVLYSSPEITGNTIVGNFASTLGGGIACGNGASPLIRGNVIECDTAGESGQGYGGGIGLSVQCNPAIDSNTIRYNRANFGAGIYLEQWCSPTITWCTVDSNEGYGSGSGIYAETNSTPTISHCRIRGNIGNGCVGLWSEGTCPTVEFCEISDNHSVGISLNLNAKCIVRWCEFVDNIGYAVAAGAGSEVETSFNWWGHSTGPFHPDSNPGGMGDTIGDGVAFRPWLGSDVIHYVHPDSTFNAIQSALDACDENEAVCVAPGTYYENLVWPNTQGIRFASRHLDSDSVTIDGDSAGSVIVIETAVDTTTWIEGFTIQRGLSSPYLLGGGGIYCAGSSPTIARNVITRNRNPSGGYIGGGILVYDLAAPHIIGNTISYNMASYGAGVALYDTSTSPSVPVVRGNLFEWNGDAWGEGGGLLCYGYPATIDGNVFMHDSARWGGGIACWCSSPSITNDTIRECVASGIGSGIYLEGNGTSPVIWGCDISDNRTTEFRGAVFCDDSSAPDIDSCRISNNDKVGVMVRSFAAPTVNNCSIYGNAEYGMFAQDCDTVDALFNWWGHPSGPYHPVLNDTGLGDTVSDYIYFIPYIGIAEGKTRFEQAVRTPATVLRGTLLMPEKETAVLLDISGRQVMDLKSGLNDLRYVAPGVYFVRRPETEDGRPREAVRKVVVQK